MARKGAQNVGKGWVMVMCRPTLTQRNGDTISTSIAGVNGLCDIAPLYTPLHTEELMVLTRVFNQAVWGELPPETAANWLNCCAAAVAVNRSVKDIISTITINITSNTAASAINVSINRRVNNEMTQTVMASYDIAGITSFIPIAISVSVESGIINITVIGDCHRTLAEAGSHLGHMLPTDNVHDTMYKAYLGGTFLEAIREACVRHISRMLSFLAMFRSRLRVVVKWVANSPMVLARRVRRRS